MGAQETTQPGVRDIARDAVRAHVVAVGIDLFTQHGFDAVTIDQVAEAAGISRRTFHRYFAAKEDLVVGDPARLGELVRDALDNRPAGEDPWNSLQHAYAIMLTRATGGGEGDRRAIHLIASTPSLRARNLEKHLLWAGSLTPLIEQRITGPDTAVQATALVHASLACLDVALTTWAHAPSAPFNETLAHVFAAIRTPPA